MEGGLRGRGLRALTERGRGTAREGSVGKERATQHRGRPERAGMETWGREATEGDRGRGGQRRVTDKQEGFAKYEGDWGLREDVRS